MSNVTVCARFRPLSLKEKRDHGENICIRSLDSETFVFKDEKEEEFTFSFDRVFYEGSEQADVYEFIALPIVQDVFNAINGTIITYGQTGAGKTYTMEGTNILDGHEQNKGLLPRVVDELFRCFESADNTASYTMKLSMVEIYMEKIRDLLDLSKDNLQIKEGKVQGIFLSGATEVSISDRTEALRHLSSGIANRAVGETQMNTASSRSHCAYIFTVRQEEKKERRVKMGKLVLVDLAGSEKAEKSGAEGRVLEEAKTINKSLSALGNVVNALTNGSPGKTNHIPYRDSKLTRILQDALGGNCRTALLCCCSPSTSNASESLSSLRFGARAKHIKTSPTKVSKVNLTPSSMKDESHERILNKTLDEEQGKLSPIKDESCKRILDMSQERMDEEQVELFPIKKESCERMLSQLRLTIPEEQVKLLEELFIKERVYCYPNPGKDLELTHEDAISHTIASLQQTVEELECTVKKLKKENKALRLIMAAINEFDLIPRSWRKYALQWILGFVPLLLLQVYGIFHLEEAAGPMSGLS